MLTAPEVPQRPGRRHGPAALRPVAAGPRAAEGGWEGGSELCRLRDSDCLLLPQLGFQPLTDCTSGRSPKACRGGELRPLRADHLLVLAGGCLPGPAPRLLAPVPLGLSPTCPPRQSPQTHRRDSPAQPSSFPVWRELPGGKLCGAATRSQPSTLGSRQIQLLPL